VDVRDTGRGREGKTDTEGEGKTDMEGEGKTDTEGETPNSQTAQAVRRIVLVQSHVSWKNVRRDGHE